VSRTIQVEADSLDEAKKKNADQTPGDLVVISIEIIQEPI
jgi:hypothetical protein